MNEYIIGAIVAGLIGGLGGGFTLADYLYANYRHRQYIKSVEQNNKIRENFRKQFLELIANNADGIDLNYLMELLSSNNPEDIKKAKKYLVDKGLISEEVQLVNHLQV